MKNVGCYYQNGIKIRRKNAFEWYMDHAEDENINSGFDPEGFVIRQSRREKLEPEHILIFKAAAGRVMKRLVKMDQSEIKGR
ncbi:39265_t:CDS:2 [Gigaspora margarita]|uniref:39265_t:CDS:1 n=1 Tax=Gigaspora margarita TaxID=4874 RepID=A0ABN7V5R9_GIGMA|nr:39265_t:CDS:2 [Gigaspora margarita]